MTNTHETLTGLFSDIADSIRSKTSSSATIKADNFPTAIEAIVTMPEGTADATATSSDILSGKTAYVKGAKVTGNIASKAATTYNTSTADQTISAGQYLSGAQTIKAVQTANIAAANIKDGITITVGDANDADRIASATGTFSDANTVSSGQSAATAGNILSGKSAFLDGAELKGSMTNNGAVSQTITSQGGTYTIPAGYHSGSGKVTAQVAATALDNTIISGEAVEESTGDYGWKTTVAVPAGYHNSQTLEKTFSEIFPAPETPATATQMLAGYQAYNKSGVLMTGTMANNGATGLTISTQGGTYTIPAGYTSGGTVTASINNGVITSGAGTATISDPAYNSTNSNFDLTASGTVAAPTVGTAGYVSSTTGTKNTNTISGSKTLAKVGTGVTITGTTTKAPTLVRTAKPSADTWVDAASGAATTTKPTSGPYVQIDAAANTGTLTATPKVTSAGYGTTSQYSASAGTATVGAAKATTAYVPITTTSRTASTGSASVTGSNVTLSDTNNGISVTATGSGSVSTGAGWVTSGSTSSNSATATKYISAVTIPSSKTLTVNMSSGSILNLYDSINQKTWVITSDTTNNALTIVQS